MTVLSNNNTWSALAKETGLDRDKCKIVLFGLLYGGIIPACKAAKATVEDVVQIRVAFDDLIEGRIDGNA